MGVAPEADGRLQQRPEQGAEQATAARRGAAPEQQVGVLHRLSSALATAERVVEDRQQAAEGCGPGARLLDGGERELPEREGAERAER